MLDSAIGKGTYLKQRKEHHLLNLVLTTLVIITRQNSQAKTISDFI